VLKADDPDEFVVQKDAEGSCSASDQQRGVRFKMGSEKVSAIESATRKRK
jgi:hypothetical protein